MAEQLPRGRVVVREGLTILCALPRAAYVVLKNLGCCCHHILLSIQLYTKCPALPQGPHGRFFEHAACGGEGERSLGDTPKPPPEAAPLDPAATPPQEAVT